MPRHAFLIIAHDQSTHLERLCRSLDYPGHRCFVHFDASSGPCPPLPAGAEPVPDPIVVNHGGFSLTMSMVRTLRHAAASGEFDFFTFLSGRDYPLRSNGELAAFLDAHSGRNFINFYPLLPGTDYHHHVSQRYFVDARSHLPSALKKPARTAERIVRFGLPARKFPNGLTPYRGSAFFTLAAETAHFVVAHLTTPAGQAQLRFFRSSWGSDEMLFQSVILNSPKAEHCRFFDRDRFKDMTNENQGSLHYIDWDDTRERPAVLDERDLEHLVGSGRFFARKFDEIRSRQLLDRLDALR